MSRRNSFFTRSLNLPILASPAFSFHSFASSRPSGSPPPDDSFSPPLDQSNDDVLSLLYDGVPAPAYSYQRPLYWHIFTLPLGKSCTARIQFLAHCQSGSGQPLLYTGSHSRLRGRVKIVRPCDTFRKIQIGMEGFSTTRSERSVKIFSVYQSFDENDFGYMEFDLEIPQVVEDPVARKRSSPYAATPPSFGEPGKQNSIAYSFFINVQRILLPARRCTLPIQITPQPESETPQLIWPRDAALCDAPEYWRKVHVPGGEGRLFTSCPETTNVQCHLLLPPVDAFTRGYPFPIHIVLTSESSMALDVFSAPSAVDLATVRKIVTRQWLLSSSTTSTISKGEILEIQRPDPNTAIIIATLGLPSFVVPSFQFHALEVTLNISLSIQPCHFVGSPILCRLPLNIAIDTLDDDKPPFEPPPQY